MRVGIAGASGFVGSELLRFCAGHPAFKVVAATADQSSGQRLGTHAPSLAAAYPELQLSSTAPSAFDDCDVVFLAMPHGQSASLVASVASPDRVVVDLGADLRFDDRDAWRAAYGTEHPAPELLGLAVPGFVERHRAELRGARLVAVPGCYPTATVLALAPLLGAGICTGPVVVDAMSGASGAGATPSAALHLPVLADDVAAYGLEGHRHVAEMEAELGFTVDFTPHLVPLDRGLLATCHAPARPGASTADALAALHRAYDDEPFVVVTEDAPRPKSVRGTNVAHVTARVSERTGGLVALCAIDNLGKGAAGQAVQCANVALGLEETAGLALAGVWP